MIFFYTNSLYIPPNTVYHHIPFNLNPRTKIEMKIASFLSMSFSFHTTINQRTKIDTKIVFFSINILFLSTKLSLTKPDPKPTLKVFSLSPYACINVKAEGGTPGICGAFDLYCLPHPREFD